MCYACMSPRRWRRGDHPTYILGAPGWLYSALTAKHNAVNCRSPLAQVAAVCEQVFLLLFLYLIQKVLLVNCSKDEHLC